MRRLFQWGGWLVAFVATGLACAKGADENDYGLGPETADGGDASASLPEGGSSSGASGSSSGSSGDGGSTSGGVGCDGRIAINEVLVGGASNANEEFVELYNPNACEVSLAGWTLEYKSKSGNSGPQIVAFANGAKIAAASFFVAGTSEFTGTKQVTMAAGMASDGASIALMDGSKKVIDAVAWGVATAGYLEGARAPAPAAGDSLARKTDGVDTNDNAADFEVATSPTPGKPN